MISRCFNNIKMNLFVMHRLVLRMYSKSSTQMAIDYAAGGRLRKLRPEEFKSMECQVESLMRNEVLLEYEEDQVRQLEEDMRKTKDAFMCLVNSLIATLKVEIEAQRVHSIKIERITRFSTHTPTVTFETLKPTRVYRVSMISNIKLTIYRTSHRHLNSNLKMAILYSFEKNKLEYEDEDEVKIKNIRTGMDKELLEHNLYKNDITLIICYKFSLTLNPPIKPKDSGSFRMKIVEPLTIHTSPSPHVAYFHRNGVYHYYHLC
ncbi:hypothetical protein Tco_0964981 [Tanacetum coccineum]